MNLKQLTVMGIYGLLMFTFWFVSFLSLDWPQRTRLIHFGNWVLIVTFFLSFVFVLLAIWVCKSLNEKNRKRARQLIIFFLGGLAFLIVTQLTFYTEMRVLSPRTKQAWLESLSLFTGGMSWLLNFWLLLLADDQFIAKQAVNRLLSFSQKTLSKKANEIVESFKKRGK